MTKHLYWIVALCLTSACSGVPLRSIPKLINLQHEILTADPADFMVAIQTDENMVPPKEASPSLILKISPRQAGDFDRLENNIPMQFTIVSANTMGLEAPPAKRKWLIYRLPEKSQADLIAIQQHIKRLQAQGKTRNGVNIAMGIAQEGVAVRDPAFSKTKWDSWIQVSRQQGFYELWSGSIAELLKQSNVTTDR